MSDITTCPKCHSELNVSTKPGEALTCPRCGYTAARPMSLPSDGRDLDVRRPAWRTAHYVVLALSIVVVLPVLILFTVCASATLWH